MAEPISFAEFAVLNLVGRSPPFIRILKRIQRLAAYEIPISIYGETGTGKELIARSIHYLSPRSSKPFIPINCGSLPDTLFENEMFGHVRGAYTDAKNTKSGLVEQAGGGVLFLDEIEDLSLGAQAKLLRFLQDKQYRALGDTAVKSSDVRIVIASNEKLEKLVERGVFRKDLYYRLNVMPIFLPPLRARTEDLELLAEFFIRGFSIQYQCPPKQLHSAVVDWMHQHDWPGNIRELENTLHRAFLLENGDIIHLDVILAECINQHEDGPEADTLIGLPFNKAKAIAVCDFEKRYLESLMYRNNGNVTQAAVQAGKERRALGKLLKKHDMNPQSYKSL